MTLQLDLFTPSSFILDPLTLTKYPELDPERTDETTFRSFINNVEHRILKIEVHAKIIASYGLPSKPQALFWDAYVHFLNSKSLEGFGGTPICGIKNIVLAVVSKMGREIRFATPQLQDDKDVVLAAVEENEEALKYASEPLKSNQAILLAYVKTRKRKREQESQQLQKMLQEKNLSQIHFVFNYTVDVNKAKLIRQKLC